VPQSLRTLLVLASAIRVAEMCNGRVLIREHQPLFLSSVVQSPLFRYWYSTALCIRESRRQHCFRLPHRSVGNTKEGSSQTLL